MLIYDDPRDDGAVTVANGYAPYPEGPARNPTAVQRGSVQYLSLYPGDPTTPGLPAYENATRTEGINIPKIPSLPISWENAQKLLSEISGGKPEDACEMVGKPSQKKVHLVNHGKSSERARCEHDILRKSSSRREGYTDLEHDGGHPGSYPQRDCPYWMSP